MKRSTRIAVGVLVALVMAGTPAVAAACAVLCSTAVTVDPAERSHEHGAPAPVAEAPAPVAAAAQAHQHHDQHHHDGRAAARETARPQAAARLTSTSTHECCDDASLVGLAPATRRADPGVSSSRISLLPSAASAAAPAFAAVFVDRATGPQFEPPALPRAPLVLRI